MDGVRSFCIFVKKYIIMENTIILKGSQRTHNKCRCCGQIKTIDNFCIDKRNSCGHNTLCKECKRKQDSEYHAKIMSDPIKRIEENKKRSEWKKNNPDKVAKQSVIYNSKPEVKLRKAEWQRTHLRINNLSEQQYILKMWRSAKYRAAAKNIPFNITVEDIIIPEYCPILNIKLDRSIGKSKNDSCTPSLDRIIPEKGYVKGNVQVISMLANTMKNHATKEQLLTFSQNIESYLNLYKEEIVQPAEN